MRFLTCLLTLSLAACGGSGSDGQAPVPQPQDLGTPPEITDIRLSRDSVFLMEGDGQVTITAEIDFVDPDLNIQTIRVEVSDGTSLTIDVPGPIPGSPGTLIGELTVSSTQEGFFTADVWMLDAAGNSSNHVIVDFGVFVDTLTWYRRDTGIPHIMNDVIWAGTQFLAVGNGGTIMTSPDGIEWTAQESGTDVRLNATFWDGYNYFVVGDGAMILFSGDGVDWTTKYTGTDEIWLQGITESITQRLVAVGKVAGPNSAYVLTSDDYGDTWQEAITLPQTGRYMTDVAWTGLNVDLFVATAAASSFPNDGRVFTSADGQTWVEIVISNESPSTLSLMRHEGELVAGGVLGLLYKSPDGVNWTVIDTDTNTNFLGMAASDTKFIADGVISAGVSTTDNGMTWQHFHIDADYDTRGLAWGANRFVSVGSVGPGFGEGAIYTTR
ncbi:MAG: hypothetical protein OEN22_04525 [Gammaproteobacteria bacterium]|nr:hypothetical protein [Gammaproteobacteria bacterium]